MMTTKIINESWFGQYQVLKLCLNNISDKFGHKKSTDILISAQFTGICINYMKKEA